MKLKIASGLFTSPVLIWWGTMAEENVEKLAVACAAPRDGFKWGEMLLKIGFAVAFYLGRVAFRTR